MPQHEIDARFPQAVFIRKTDLEIEVHADDRLFGYLDISKGGIDWIPAGGRSRYSFRWETFDKLARGGTVPRPLRRKRRLRRRTRTRG
jgi:hypothetical protein